MTLRYLIPLSAALLAPAAHATCSTEPILGSICMFAGNFCPRSYAEAAGQTLAISQNTALFSILGTTYGGNGQTTFALPDLRGRSAIGDGQGPGLSQVGLGERAGTETVTLNVSQMPVHSHAAVARGTTGAGTTDSPASAVPAKLARSNIYSSGAADTNMGTSAITVTSAGGSQPVPMRNPYLGLKMCIALEGIFPSRN
ncbi:phage tail protein [Roseateles sp. LKC17W]|uniref:Phage tail protein n=1 Tax=Pelomonas margarita TaxID=3299031 RepID=A0ABW7FN45_9BURK